MKKEIYKDVKKILHQETIKFRKLYRKQQKLEKLLWDIEIKMFELKYDLSEGIDNIVWKDFNVDIGWNIDNYELYTWNIDDSENNTIYMEIKERIKIYLKDKQY